VIASVIVLQTLHGLSDTEAMAVRSDRITAPRLRYCCTCRRDTLNRVTTTIDVTQQDEDVNAAG
jgi:hypothetical protein